MEWINKALVLIETLVIQINSPGVLCLDACLCTSDDCEIPLE